MEKMDLMYLDAGEVIHYRGMPLYLAQGAHVLGNRANFVFPSGTSSSPVIKGVPGDGDVQPLKAA